MNQNNNPWKGVVPYSDSVEDLKLHPFRGRSKEVLELFDEINNEAIVTLYGRSGIGKTSLLQAGLFPVLRKSGCYPVSIRLENECSDGNYAAYIVEQLAGIAVLRNNSVNQQEFAEEENGDYYLWEYFSQHDFFDGDDRVIPVIVLDQFEEVLRRHPDQSLTLLRQLRTAKNEGYRSDGSFFEVNYRIVISIREDDLYLLEDALDRHYIDRMKTGRYRLKPIEQDTAINEIVFIRDGLFDSDGSEVAKRIVREYATQNGVVSTVLLSLVCSMAYEAAGGGVINAEVVETLGKNPLVTFYKRSIAGMPDEFVDWFEDSFLDADRRKTVYENEIPNEYVNYVQELAKEQSKQHLLTKASKQAGLHMTVAAFELLHDKLAEAISMYRSERQAILQAVHRKVVIRRWTKVSIIVAIVTIAIVVFVRLAYHPIDFVNTESSSGEQIPIQTFPYRIPDGVLRLKDCTLAPYTFYGNREVRRVELDGVDIPKDSHALYLPNADTLVVGGEQWRYAIDVQSLPQINTIIATRPTVPVNSWTKVQYLDTVIIPSADSNYVRWDGHIKTLYARHDSISNWKAYASALNWVFSQSDMGGSYYHYVDYDIAHPADSLIPWNYYYRLINTDSVRFRRLRKGDIPEDVLSRTSFVDINYVDTIEDSAFFQNINKCSVQLISLPSVKYIGKQLFNAWGNTSYIYIPMANYIGEGAFAGCCTEKTVLRYNKDAKIEKEAFGKGLDARMLAYTSKEINKTEQSGNDYYVSNDTLWLKSNRIDELYIAPNVREIMGESSIGKIKCDKYNMYYSEWRGNLYKRDEGFPIQLRADQRRVVSLPQMLGNMKMSSMWCQEFVCLHRDDIDNIQDKSRIVLLVPYGSEDSFNTIGEMFAGVRQLSWYETLWYKTLYGSVQKKIHDKLFAESNDILAIFSTFMVMLMIALAGWLKRKRFRYVVIDFIVLVFFVSVIGYIVSPYGFSVGHLYITSDGEAFHTVRAMYNHLRESEAVFAGEWYSMWPTLWIMFPVWVSYLLVMRRYRKQKRMNVKK